MVFHIPPFTLNLDEDSKMIKMTLHSGKEQQSQRMRRTAEAQLRQRLLQIPLKEAL